MKTLKMLICVLSLFAITIVAVTPTMVLAESTTAQVVDGDYRDPDAGDVPFNPTENAGENFCEEPGVKTVLKFAGAFLYIARMMVPLIIIIRGFFIFFKAVTADDDRELKKQAIEFGKRIAFGILIFFIPTLLSAIWGLFVQFKIIQDEYEACATCMMKPMDC